MKTGKNNWDTSGLKMFIYAEAVRQGYRKSDLAKALGCSPGAITHLLNPDNGRGIAGDKLAGLMSLLGLRVVSQNGGSWDPNGETFQRLTSQEVNAQVGVQTTHWECPTTGRIMNSRGPVSEPPLAYQQLHQNLPPEPEPDEEPSPLHQSGQSRNGDFDDSFDLWGFCDLQDVQGPADEAYYGSQLEAQDKEREDLLRENKNG